jgi:magnesium chelatase family protein
VGLARAFAVAVIGIRGHIVSVEATMMNGTPGLHLVGLPDAALVEARDRVRAAVVNSGEQWPNRRVTVSLYPATLPKCGSGFDAAIAVAILGAARAVPLPALDGVVILGELGLDGRLRQVAGILPAVLAAADAGMKTCLVPGANHAEADLVPGIAVRPMASLARLLAYLRDEPPPADATRDDDDPPPLLDRAAGRSEWDDLDLADVRGQGEARRAVEVCAAGGHHMWLAGPAGCGKTMLVERMPSILPALDRDQALEVTAIHSVAGALPPGGPLITRPPLCAPHHSATTAAIVGGGSGRLIRPGAVSLSHRGLLFLDEAPEFRASVIDALRQPLEEGHVLISRAAATARFPARFTLVLAANPCPCAASDPKDCVCSPGVRRRYLNRLSGPILDRLDLKVWLRPVSRAHLRYDIERAESSRVVAERVRLARERTATRLAGTPWRTNAEVPGHELRTRFSPGSAALGLLDRPLADGRLSARGLDRVVRVAWTLADLRGCAAPQRDDIHIALGLWEGMNAGA